jgi:Asp-tRNA(Asn)/Glu-tRNA(Gln) amidotransferase A subunit family amidase
MSDLLTLGAIEATAAIRDRRLRSTEVVDACLTRILARDQEIHAFARLAPDARERAQLADLAPLPLPLQGVPVAIKDIIDTADLGTEYGSPIFAGHVPKQDANCVMRLKAAGAIVIGKTVTTEFAHVTPQATRNPRDLSRTPGGSSSGSAAAVADGMVPVALGTHTVGWFARNALDLSLLGRVLLRDGKRWPPAPDRPRLARAVTPYDSVASAAALRARDEACAELATEGAEVTTIELPKKFGQLNAVHRRVVSVEASRAFARYAKQHPDKLSPALSTFIAEGRKNEAGYEEARAIATEMRHELTVLMQDVDALVLPAATGEAPEGLGSTGDATFSLFLSLLGPPCATIPAAKGENGLPIGVQLVSKFNQDEALLALVEWAAARVM